MQDVRTEFNAEIRDVISIYRFLLARSFFSLPSLLSFFLPLTYNLGL